MPEPDRSWQVTTRILRERQRPLWRRLGVLLPLLLVVLALGVAIMAWRLGGPVPVKAIAIALPDSEVGAASSGMGG